MTSFDLTEDQQSFVDAVHKYSQKDLRNHLREGDESGELHKQVLDIGWSLGFVAAGIPAKYDGFADEQAAVTAALIYEELAWGDLSAAIHLLTPTLLAYPLRQYGSDNQKALFLPQLCRDSPPALTAALIEPSYQFNPHKLNTTASFNDGTYTLNGKKIYVPLADWADTILVYAKDMETRSTQAFLVQRDNPGLSVGEREKLMGVKALPTYPLTLSNCTLDAASRVGEDHDGLQISVLLARSNVALAALAVGVGRAALEYSTDYAKNREAFGEPIASRQSIAFMLAEMAIEIDATRLMVWEAAWRLDHGKDAVEQATLARMYGDEMVLKVADSAVQVLGGHGYIREHPVELWLRNARGFATFDGLAVV